MSQWDEDRGNPSGYNVTGGKEQTLKPELKGVKKAVLAYIGRLKGKSELIVGMRRRTRVDMKNDIMREDRSLNSLEASERKRVSAEIIRVIGDEEDVTVSEIIKVVRKARGYETLSDDATILLINALRDGNDIPISDLEPKQTFDGTGDRHGPSM